MTSKVQRAVVAALGVTCLYAAAAQAAGVCTGTISGSPLRPLAQPAQIALDHHLDSVANQDLAKQFLAGLRTGGVAVEDKGEGSTSLDLSFLLRGTTDGAKPGAYHDLSWMRGEAMSSGVRSALRGAHIDVTIYARDVASRSLAWTGAINCTIQTDDANALAEGLGSAVGKALGKSVPRQPL